MYLNVGEGQAANLVLLDGAALTIDCGGSWYEAGLAVVDGRALNIFGVEHGVVTATGGRFGAGIGGGASANGGSVKTKAFESQPKNGAGKDVYCVVVEVEKLNVERLNVEGLEAYGITGARVVDGKVYLRLPNGEYKFSLWNGNEKVGDYRAVVNGAAVTNATRQIPVGAIARLSDVSAVAQHPEIATLTVTTNVTVNGCAPGFFYSLYDGWALTNIVADANATNLNVLCGADAKVVFPEVKKPSEKAGFFKVGVGVTDNAGK